ncbi:unnamed protein product [Taenia asiatica]|uniref:Uncharacterized protein n=1 Tax=Taenia asiatica TaxID=60517 RepID=A0A0R3WE73_TAEAS|nr:unnamed protein product [Taenia asiatica]
MSPAPLHFTASCTITACEGDGCHRKVKPFTHFDLLHSSIIRGLLNSGEFVALVSVSSGCQARLCLSALPISLPSAASLLITTPAAILCPQSPALTCLPATGGLAIAAVEIALKASDVLEEAAMAYLMSNLEVDPKDLAGIVHLDPRYSA